MIPTLRRDAFNSSIILHVRPLIWTNFPQTVAFSQKTLTSEKGDNTLTPWCRFLVLTKAGIEFSAVLRKVIVNFLLFA